MSIKIMADSLEMRNEMKRNVRLFVSFLILFITAQECSGMNLNMSVFKSKVVAVDGNHFKQEENLEMEYMACFDTWINNPKSLSPSYFNINHHPQSCSEYCQSKSFQVSLLKGGECSCKSITNFHLAATPDFRCNVPCPVSEMMNPDQTPTTPSSSCGGNTVYSVYCRNSEHSPCSELPMDGGIIPSPTTTNIVPQSKSAPISCGRCNVGSRCMTGAGSEINPSYDYFPKNDPISCRTFCGTEKRYRVVSGTNEDRVRGATKYAVLMWDRVLFKNGGESNNGGPIPICRCMSDVESFVEVDESEYCNTSCPGDPEGSKCGSMNDPGDGAFYASIHCTKDDCSDPSTTTTKMSTTTEVITTTKVSTTTTNDAIEETTSYQSDEGDPNYGDGPEDEDECMDENYSAIECTTTTSTQNSTQHSTTSTEQTPSDINCFLQCNDQEFSGRWWSVCAGMVEDKSCDTPNSEGKAVWKCSDAGEWVTEQPDYSGCKSEWIEEIVEDSFRVNDTNSALLYLTKLDELISSPSSPSYFGHEIQIITSVLGRVVDSAFASHSDVPNFSEKFEPIVTRTISLSSVLVSNPTPWHQLSTQNRSSISTSLFSTVEETSLLLASVVELSHEIVAFEKELSPLEKTSEYFVVAGSFSRHLNNNGSLQFPSERVLVGGIVEEKSRLKLPTGWQNNLVQGNESDERVEYVGFWLDPEQANLMMPGQFKSLGYKNMESLEKTTLNGKIMSFTVSTSPSGSSSLNQIRAKRNIQNRTDFKKSLITFPGKGVEITFHHDLEAWGESRVDLKRKLHFGEKPKAVLGSVKCVYWDTVKMIWSSTGCKRIESNRFTTICECNHLTSFAVLMDVHNYLGKDLGLEILTLILCSLSFLCLFCAVGIFCTFHGLQNERNSITKNLSICLLIGNTLVLLVLDRNYFNMSEGVCIASGIVTHYIFLSAFAWMGIEGLHLYRMVVHVFDSQKNPLKLYRVLGYGIPLIIVILTSMVGYLNGEHPYGGDIVCWLNGDYIWSFLVPVLFVVVENLIILFIALKTAYQVQYSSSNKTKIPLTQQQLQTKIKSFRIWLRGCLSLTILLGVTWIFGFFTLVPKSSPGLVFAYLFTILNATQGIFIFLFHCVYNEKVRSLTMAKFGLPSWISSSFQNNTSIYSSNSTCKKNTSGSGIQHSASDSSLCNKEKEQGPMNEWNIPKIEELKGNYDYLNVNPGTGSRSSASTRSRISIIGTGSEDDEGNIQNISKGWTRVFPAVESDSTSVGGGNITDNSYNSKQNLIK